MAAVTIDSKQAACGHAEHQASLLLTRANEAAEPISKGVGHILPQAVLSAALRLAYGAAATLLLFCCPVQTGYGDGHKDRGIQGAVCIDTHQLFVPGKRVVTPGGNIRQGCTPWTWKTSAACWDGAWRIWPVQLWPGLIGPEVLRRSLCEAAGTCPVKLTC
jgi:hypothetical protein